MIYLNARLRLISTKRHKIASGKPMTTGFGYADIQGETGFPLSLVCWNDIATELARYGSGDTLTVSGRLQANDYVKNDESVKGYQLIVEGIMGSKRTAAYQNEVKPKKRQTAATQPHENQTGAVRLDDVPSF
jgi:single-stranded DNA-binding protein